MSAALKAFLLEAGRAALVAVIPVALVSLEALNVPWAIALAILIRAIDRGLVKAEKEAGVLETIPWKGLLGF